MRSYGDIHTFILFNNLGITNTGSNVSIVYKCDAESKRRFEHSLRYTLIIRIRRQPHAQFAGKQ